MISGWRIIPAPVDDVETALQGLTCAVGTQAFGASRLQPFRAKKHCPAMEELATGIAWEGFVAKTTRAVAKTAKTAAKSVKKHVGDVIGIGRARVPKDVPRATKDRGGRPKGIEVSKTTRRTLKRAGVVGGVRGRR